MAGNDESGELQGKELDTDRLPPAPSHSLFRSQTVFPASSTTARLDGPPPAAHGFGPQPGDLVAGRYRVVRMLGSGGMGQVFEVKHERLGNRFALKCLNDDLLADDDARRLFYREARFASSLSHPRIPTIVDYGDDVIAGSFMVMEYVDGETLESMVERSGPLQADVAVTYALQVAGAIGYVHGQDLVHGDIKANNVIVTSGKHGLEKVAKLVDFGLARTKALGKTPVRGTVAYIAPERIRGEPATAVSDIYSLGVLLYFLLSGRVPFAGDAVEVLHAHMSSPVPSLGSEVPAPLESLVMQSVAKDPRDRPQSMAKVVSELRRASRELGLGRGHSRPTAPHTSLEALLMPTFASFLLPIGVVSPDGAVIAGNVAFERLLSGISTDLAGQNLIDTPLAEVWPSIGEDVAHAAAGELVRRVVTEPNGTDQYLVWLEPSPVAGYVTIGAHPIVHYAP